MPWEFLTLFLLVKKLAIGSYTPPTNPC